jgi:hypothetical protein
MLRAFLLRLAMTSATNFKLIAFAKFLGWSFGWFLLILLLAAVQSPPQAMATFLLIGIVGIPIGFVRLLLICFGIIRETPPTSQPAEPKASQAPLISAEVVARFPRIGIANTPENAEFIRQSNVAKSNGIDVDPMHLAERVVRAIHTK